MEDNASESHKITKWALNTLESVHPNEFGKTRTRSSTRQEDGGNVDDSTSYDPNLSNKMEYLFGCELNLSSNNDPISFEEASSHDEWKESMLKEYASLIKNGTWKLADPPYGTKPIGWK